MHEGIILIDKPKGITSYDVVRQLKKHFNTKRIGHAGVLDKPASGLLICAVGRATKVLSLFESGYKIYVSEIQLGIKTDTYDLEGSVLDIVDNIFIDRDKILSTLEDFIGTIEQKAPIYSNIKVNGKRLHRYAKDNQSVDLPIRRVEIYGIELLNYAENTLNIMVKCSKGTYIRSLANDIGERLGVFGAVKSLRRIFSYPFSVDMAATLENIEIIPLNKALNFIPSLRVEDSLKDKIKNGVPFERLFDCRELQNGLYKILDKDGELTAIIEKNKTELKYRFISI